MLKEIHNQPEHIRALFMWLSVFIVFSLVIFLWLNSFQQKLVLLLNSDKKEAAKPESPLAIMGSGLSDLKATIADLFGLASGRKNELEIKNSLENRFGTKIEPNLLPVSE